MKPKRVALLLGILVAIAGSFPIGLFLIKPELFYEPPPYIDYALVWSSNDRLVVGGEGLWVFDAQLNMVSSLVKPKRMESYSVSLSPDHTMILAVHKIGGGLGTLHLWSTETFTPIPLAEQLQGVFSTVWAHDSKHVISVSPEKKIRSIEVPLLVYGMAFSEFASGSVSLSSHCQLPLVASVTCCEESTLFILNTNTGHVVRSHRIARLGLSALEWHPSMDHLAFESDRTVLIWDIDGDQMEETLSWTGTEFVGGVSWSPDGLLLGIALSSEVFIWDVVTKHVIQLLKPDKGWVNAIAWSPNGKYLAVIGVTSTLRLYETHSWVLLRAHNIAP